MNFHPLRNYKIVSVLIKELLILVGVLKTSFIKSVNPHMSKHTIVQLALFATNVSSYILNKIVRINKYTRRNNKREK